MSDCERGGAGVATAGLTLGTGVGSLYQMRARIRLLGVCLAGAVACTGCSKKQESPASGGADEVTSRPAAAQPAAGTALDQGRKLAESAQAAVEQAAAQAQLLIDQTKTYLSQQNYAEAAKGLEKLTGMRLTAEQQQLVKDLQVELSKVGQAAGGKLTEVKALVDAERYQEASAKLAELVEVELTAEQKQLLEKLKAEIQKGLSAQTIDSSKKALGGVLQGK